MRRILLLISLAATLAVAESPRFVTVPAGSFQLGCDPRLNCAEIFPKKMVTFSRPFLMARTETTVGQFRRFAKATGYRTEAEKAGDKFTWQAPGFPLSDKQPVVFMTLNDAAAYCEWIGARLPTEAEWEYAARAGSTTYHYWGEEIDARYLWYFGNAGGKPRPVGRKLPNAWGLHDMEGNAWEWVLPSPPHTSITGPDYGSIRGGSWMTCPEPYRPDKNGVRGRQIGLSVPLEVSKNGNFRRTWRRYDSGFRCGR
jgi:formylglycine-generating enzyme required for sulfatase activity